MKTAVSIPDEVFAGAERLARRTKKSRSKLFSDAVKEYVARHAPEEVTDAMDRVRLKLGNSYPSHEPHYPNRRRLRMVEE